MTTSTNPEEYKNTTSVEYDRCQCYTCILIRIGEAEKEAEKKAELEYLPTAPVAPEIVEVAPEIVEVAQEIVEVAPEKIFTILNGVWRLAKNIPVVDEDIVPDLVPLDEVTPLELLTIELSTEKEKSAKLQAKLVETEKELKVTKAKSVYGTILAMLVQAEKYDGYAYDSYVNMVIVHALKNNFEKCQENVAVSLLQKK